MTDLELAIRFFLQLAVLLGVCRLVGYLGRFIGQTQVVCEMIAGVLLGPSLLGWIWPEAQQSLFPKTATLPVPGGESIAINHPSMSILYVVSQLALVMYMFLVGLEFDFDLVKTRKRSAALVSLSGILAPMLLGGAVAFLLHDRADCFTPDVGAWSAALFVGAAMSITAFPMLARIIYECGIAKTSMGSLALGAAAIDDAAAWCLLAIVLSVTKNDFGYAIYAIGGGTAFAVFMIVAARPLLTFLERWRQRIGALSSEIMLTTFGIILFAAWVTDSLGIYAVFGAFLTGVVMPRGQFAADLRHQMERFVTVLLLPLFFVYSGLNTKIGLINSVELWGVTLLLVVIAMVCKGVACAVTSRMAGETWKDSAKIGTLMNARGLIELIILNIGLQKGVITPTFFTMMVIMAIVTTLIASPIFNKLHWGRISGPKNLATADGLD